MKDKCEKTSEFPPPPKKKNQSEKKGSLLKFRAGTYFLIPRPLVVIRNL